MCLDRGKKLQVGKEIVWFVSLVSYRKHLLLTFHILTLEYFEQESSTLSDKGRSQNQLKKINKEFTLETVKISDLLHDVVLLFKIPMLRYTIQKNQSHF